MATDAFASNMIPSVGDTFSVPLPHQVPGGVVCSSAGLRGARVGCEEAARAPGHVRGTP